MKKEKGIYQRNEGRWEARFKVGINDNGRAKYRSVYAQTKEEVIARRDEILCAITITNPKRVNVTYLNLLILGAGIHGRDIYEIAKELHVFKEIGFLDDFEEGQNILGKCEDVAKYRDKYPCAFIAIGDNEIRKKYAKLLQQNGFLIPSVVSPVANISSKAKIGEGVAILPHATVGEAEIGDFSILASNSLVNSECILEEFSHVDCGAIVKKGTTVPAGTMIDIGMIF